MGNGTHAASASSSSWTDSASARMQASSVGNAGGALDDGPCHGMKPQQLVAQCNDIAHVVVFSPVVRS